MVIERSEYDGVWRPERQTSGAWIVQRLTWLEGLNNPRNKEIHGRPFKGEILPRFFDTFDQAQAKADELNGGA